MLRTVSVGTNIINYNLTYKDVKNINLRIKVDGSVSVSAPRCVNALKIDDFVISKSEYILSSLEKFKKMQEFAPKPKKYVSGESFNLLGSNLMLKVISAQKDEVFSDGVYLILNVRNTDDFAKKQRLVNKWIKDKTITTYNEVANDVYKEFKKHNVSFPKIRIRKMSTRWGSCQPAKGIVTLNSRLIEAPRICIEYVLMHEFCHFIHPNHSKKFYSLLQTMMPDWKERKKLLESNVYLV